VVSVQNRYNLLDRGSEAVLEACAAAGIAFLPWFPVAVGELARPGGPLDAVAAATGATPAQLALAWLLHRSPVLVPIPGTSSVAHLEENVAPRVSSSRPSRWRPWRQRREARFPRPPDLPAAARLDAGTRRRLTEDLLAWADGVRADLPWRRRVTRGRSSSRS
jgi:hypothetical protein